jgi:membrane protease YdiL (CAAX protease family)
VYLVFPIWALLCGSLFDHGGAAAAGTGGPPLRSLFELLGGLLAGGGLNAAGLGLLWLGAEAADGSVTITATVFDARMALAWCSWLLLFAIAATWEEVIFRGYGFVWAGRAVGEGLDWIVVSTGALTVHSRRIALYLGRAPVLFISCLIFSLVHLGNPSNAGIFPVVNTALAGLWLAVCVYRSRGLWAAIGMHWGWNATMGLLLGVPVSGVGTEESGLAMPGLLTTALEGPDWFTGAGYGLEGSAAATIVLALGVVTSLAWPGRKGDEQMPALEIS